MSGKQNTNPLLTQREITEKYGLSKRAIDKYLPKPIVKSGRRRSGGWYYSRYWRRLDVEAAMLNPELATLSQETKRSRRIEKDRYEARILLSSYNPEGMVQKARNLKRVFVLHVGPTNSGKTYDAVKALESSASGTYLGPLRLLALEMYDRINADGISCSLLTGEEYIPAENAVIVSSTIELCDFSRRFEVAVIDEAQLITDRDRGAAWFRAICLVDAQEVHICLAPEALPVIEKLIQEFNDPYTVVRHKRLVPLEYKGRCNGYADIHPYDAIICFSRKNVLSTAALLERNGFKASVIYGALPPVARRNEVEKYTSGQTNVVVATDAIGMGISLPIRRVIFAETHKFDGKDIRPLTASEVKQIAGRAGRYGMFDLGEVLTMDNTETVSRGMNNTPRMVRTLCIAFPREVLDTDYPLDILLSEWQNLPRADAFSREDMKDALTLYRALRQDAEGQDRQLLYDIITCPVDTRTHELVLYWLSCARAILKGRRIPHPHFGTETLYDCELEYKAYDIRHQLMRRIGEDDGSTDAHREQICRRIKELMEEDKSGYIRKCTCCGKELPIGYIFNLCENCYNLSMQ